METTTQPATDKKITTLNELNLRIIVLKKMMAGTSLVLDYTGNEEQRVTIKELPDDLINQYADENNLPKFEPNKMIKYLWTVENTPWGKLYLNGQEKEYAETLS